MKILGIDPGTATVGFGIIEMTGRDYRVLDFGHISTEKTLSAPQRLNEIATDLQALCEQWEPDICAVEELFFSKNVTTALKVSEARGVILQTLNRRGYPIHEYNPMQIKLAIVRFMEIHL